MTPTSVFPNPLLRLILCGGGGLSPAWGPLHSDPNGPPWAWNPHNRNALVSCRTNIGDYDLDGILASARRWSLPLDPSSPWRGRLAMVAAWMCQRPAVGAWVGGNDHFLSLTILLSRGALIQPVWRAGLGTRHAGGAMAPDLPTLPTHLSTYPPEAALVLALYALPDVAARVATASTT